MFLLGGPAFSGKTLLALLLNQGDVACLDEPDFHNSEQRHRGLPVLQARFPSVTFPALPDDALTHEQAVEYLVACERALQPTIVGMKTSDFTFIRYAEIYAGRGYPIVAMMRDIRDVLAESPLPPWVGGAAGLIERYQRIWRHRDRFDLLIRYEELVADPKSVFDRISALLSQQLHAPSAWPADSVDPVMFKLPRHALLAKGAIVGTQVGIWRTRPDPGADVHAVAALTGY